MLPTRMFGAFSGQQHTPSFCTENHATAAAAAAAAAAAISTAGDEGALEEVPAATADVRTWQITRAIRHLLGAHADAAMMHGRRIVQQLSAFLICHLPQFAKQQQLQRAAGRGLSSIPQDCFEKLGILLCDTAHWLVRQADMPTNILLLLLLLLRIAPAGAESVGDHRNRHGSRTRTYEPPARVPDSNKDTDTEDAQGAARRDAEYVLAVRFPGLV
jgi:hypothetical protein